jgi:hypothetical protein
MSTLDRVVDYLWVFAVSFTCLQYWLSRKQSKADSSASDKKLKPHFCPYHLPECGPCAWIKHQYCGTFPCHDRRKQHSEEMAMAAMLARRNSPDTPR